MRHVQLEKSWTLSIRLSYGLNRLRSGGGKAVRDIEFLRDGRNGEFSEGVVALVYADGRDADWSGDFVAEDGGAGGARVGVDELAGDYAVSEESLAVREVRVGLAGVGGSVVPVNCVGDESGI